VKAGGDVLRVADAEEGELLDHQPRDDLRLVRALQRGLHRQQILLADEEGVQPDLDAVEVVVHVAQPLVFVLVVALGLVAEQGDSAAAIARAGLLDLVDQPRALGRIAAAVGIGVADGVKHAGEERPLGMPRLVLGLRMVGHELRLRLGQEHAQVFDRPRLADARGSIGQRARDVVAQAAVDQVGERLDGWRSDAVGAGLDGVKGWIDGPTVSSAR
jgi:hypothetical protein